MSGRGHTSVVTVGVDIGTTSVKAVAADADGHPVAVVRIPHETRSPTAGVLEHDAALAWCDGARLAAVEVATRAAETGHRVAGVDVAAMVPSLCAVDGDGRPISPGLLYGDTRPGAGARGADPSSSGELARMLAWLADHYPDAAGFWPAQAVANAALCGRGVLDTVTAMTAAPLFDLTGWAADAVAAAGARIEQLPELVGGSSLAGRCRAELGPALADVPLGPGTVDAFADQLVAGADGDGDVLVILGATLIVWAVVPEWVEVPGLWTVPHSAAGKVLVGGPSNAGGLFRNWAERTLMLAAGLPDDPAAVPVWLPFLRGERAPLHDADRRGELHGLDLSHGPAALWRAVHEAAGFVIRRHLSLAGLLPGGSGPTTARRLVVSGGGSASAEWVQAIADVVGLPADCVAVPEGGALGSAYLARVSAGLERDARAAGRWARVGRRVEPDPAWAAAASRRYERYVELSGTPFDHLAGAPR